MQPHQLGYFVPITIFKIKQELSTVYLCYEEINSFVNHLSSLYQNH